MLRVDVVNAHRRYRLRRRTLAGYARSVLRGEGRTAASITIVCIDGRRCRDMNRRFLRHDYATDVISFPLEPGENAEAEIYVNLDRAREQARQYGVSFGNEVARLVIHGTLHIVGYDDRRAGDARTMRAREEAFLAKVMPGKRKMRA